jgi:pimeloyl-ACP methyl ester carboxylesterase
MESEENPGQYGPEGHEIFKRVTTLAAYIKSQFNVDPSIQASCFTKERRLIVSSSLNHYNPTTPTDEEYLDNTHQLMNDYTHIYVVGHSYGGWLAMKLMETWNGDQNAVKSVYTLDPISKELCYFNNPDECVSAPNDISDAGRQHIQDYSGIWVNPWQENTLFLHSSRIPQADMNPQYDVTHWSMLPNDDIWFDIRSRVSM